MTSKRVWQIKDWAIAASFFVSAATGIGIIWRVVSGGARAVDSHIEKVAVESKKLTTHIARVARDSTDCTGKP